MRACEQIVIYGLLAAHAALAVWGDKRMRSWQHKLDRNNSHPISAGQSIVTYTKPADYAG